MMIGNSGEGAQQNEGGSNGSDGGVGGGTQLKKGPWTAAEDAILADYVRKHGEGNWNAVQKNTGLARCGKSCRLRWANHLRPNLKKGAFSPEEERIIVELHAKLGNKWARMATQLPGRTDNEIKNFWNTRVKRRQRQGLPLYPPDIQPLNHHQLSSPPHNQHFTHYLTHSEPATPISSTPTTPTAFSFQTTPTLHMPATPTPPSLLSPHCTTSTTLNSPHHTTPMLLSPTPPNASPLPSPRTPVYPTLPLFDPSASASNPPTTTTTNSSFFSPRTPPFLQTPLRFKRLHRQAECENSNINSFNFNPGNTTATSDSTTSSFAFPFSPLLRSSRFGHTTTTTSMPITPHYPSFASKPFCFDPSTSLRTVGSHTDLGQLASIPDYVYPLRTELPSSQFLFQDSNPEITFSYRVNDGNGGDINSTNEYQNLGESSSGSGLLEDLLEEAQAMAGSSDGFGRQSCFSSQEEKQVLDGFSPWGDSSSVVLRPKEETADQMQTAHENLSKQDNVTPSSMQVPDWYTGDSREASNGQSSVVTDDNLGLDMHQLASLCPIDTTADHGRVPSWDNNFPGIC